MNAIESLFMRAANKLVKSIKQLPDEDKKLANEEALAVLKKLDPAKLQGLVVMAIQSCEDEESGEDGLELTSSMIGSPELIIHLAEGAKVFTKMYQLNEMREKLHKAGLGEYAKGTLADELLNNSEMSGGAVEGRYAIPPGTTRQ